MIGDGDEVVVSREHCKSILEKSLERIETEKKKAAQLREEASNVALSKRDKVFESLGLIED